MCDCQDKCKKYLKIQYPREREKLNIARDDFHTDVERNYDEGSTLIIKAKGTDQCGKTYDVLFRVDTIHINKEGSFSPLTITVSWVDSKGNICSKTGNFYNKRLPPYYRSDYGTHIDKDTGMKYIIDNDDIGYIWIPK